MRADDADGFQARPTSGSDLAVEQLSDALAGRRLDVVVSGSIAAVESVRFVRALRRLGADVQPWLTAGGAAFVTPLALAWASARETRCGFAGDASHIALADVCVVAPASASLIGKVAAGITDTPATALITSYLGQGKPVLLLPSMHLSLAQAPAVAANLRRLAEFGVQLLSPRLEEDKQKFPDPEILADIVAHRVNAARHSALTPTASGEAAAAKTVSVKTASSVLITMGTTRGYVDDVRYLSNYSSGAIGSAIAEELFRQGVATYVVCGPCPIVPRVSTQLRLVETNDEMRAAALAAVGGGRAQAAVFAASVLDYVPASRQTGKISSSRAELTIACKPTEKIIGAVQPNGGAKVGFKLEVGLSEARAGELAADYAKKYDLSAVVLNDLADVDATRHRAYIFEAAGGRLLSERPAIVDGKRSVAMRVAAHVCGRPS